MQENTRVNGKLDSRVLPLGADVLRSNGFGDLGRQTIISSFCVP